MMKKNFFKVLLLCCVLLFAIIFVPEKYQLLYYAICVMFFFSLVLAIYEALTESKAVPSGSDMGYARIRNFAQPYDFWYRIAIHEMGHMIMAEYFSFPVEKINISFEENWVRYTVPDHITADKLRSIIIICYSGYYAEKILLQSASTGSINDDFEQANDYLKKYLVLTEEISVSMKDSDMNEKIVKYSRKFAEETQALVIKKRDQIQEEAENYLKEYLTKVSMNGSSLYAIKKSI